MSDDRAVPLPATRPGSAGGAGKLEHQLAVAQQITHIGSWEWDLTTGAIAWSDELYRIYGLAPQSRVIDLAFFKTNVHPDDRRQNEAKVRSAIERGERFQYQERIIRPDGSVRHVDTLGEVIRDVSGSATALIGTCRDVTEERERDETIRFYVNIVENVHFALSVWQVNGSDSEPAALVAFNPALERATGIRLSSWLGSPWHRIFPQLSNQELPELIERVAREGGVRELPAFRFTAAANAIFSGTAFPLAGSYVGLALEDVTVPIRARNLRESEQRLLESIASGEELETVLTTLILVIEEHAPRTVGSILLVDPDGEHLSVGAAPNLPAEFHVAARSLRMSLTATACGASTFTRRPVVSSDIANDPNWAEYRELALSLGLRACSSMPIVSSEGRVLGAFALYFREPRHPEPEEQRLIERATHLAKIAIHRKESDDQLRALSAHIEAVREDERTAVSREIHDDLGQALTALKMDIAWLARRLAKDSALTPGAAVERLDAMARMTDEIIQRVRRLSVALRPAVLDDIGLVAALEWQAQEFEQRTSTTCCLRSSVPDERFDPRVSTEIFRIFQEALTNVARHAQASRVEASLSEQDGQLCLEIVDDGKGLPVNTSSRAVSLGLLGMRERALRLGGSATITGAPGEGTRVTVRVPSSTVRPR